MLSIIDGVEQLQTFFGQYMPQVVDRRLRAAGDLRLHGVLGRAGRHRDAGRRAVHPGGASGGARAHRPASRERQRAFKAFGEEFLDAVQGLPTLKAFGQSGAYGRMLADKARALSDSTFLVLGTSILTRGITDLGCAFGAAAALALGA